MPSPAAQCDAVEQQCREHAGIAGIAFAEFEHGLGFGGECRFPRTEVVHRAVEHGRHQHVQVGLGRGDPGGEQRPQPVGLGLPGQQADEWVQVRDGERAHQLDAARDGPETGQRLERPQCHEEFRFVAAVAVVARRRRHRDVQPVLTGETVGSLFCTRMRLEREWFIGREHLGQKRQRVAEAFPDGRTQLPLRVGLDHLEQRLLAMVRLQPGRITRMRAEPQLRFGMRRRTWPLSEFGNRGARTPRVSPQCSV